MTVSGSMAAPLTCFLFLLSWLPGHGKGPEGNAEPRDPTLRHVTDQFWQWKLREFPEVATSEGFHGYDDRLESYDYGTMSQRAEFCRQLLQQLEFVNISALADKDRLTYHVLADQLRTYVHGYQWRDYGALNPLNFMEGVHKSFSWIVNAKYNSIADYDKYYQRLNTIPNQIEEIVQLLERAVSSRKTNHIVSLRGVLDEISNISDVPPHSTPFYIPYDYNLDILAADASTRMALRRQGVSVIESKVQPSYRRLRDYVQKRYIPFTRPEVGVGSLDNGKQYYRNVLKWHLSVNMTAEEVHQIGLMEMGRIRIEMEKLMRWLDHNGDFKSFFRYLRSDPKFYDHSQIDLLEKYKNIVYKRIQPRLPLLFADMSSVPNVSVRSMTHDGLDAYYTNGWMVINTFHPQTKPEFTALTLCLHEALPGHHLQKSVARNQALPTFRKHNWYNKRYAVPFHLPFYSAYVEGWALYAEFLGEEMGLFDDPYELFGRYTMEIFRAGRLVVDTGIHVLGWSRGEAIEFLANNTFMTHAQLEKEVDRYITWPGQACAYKIGELKLRELRSRAINRLGWRYSPHEFHQRTLEIGPVSLSLLEDHIDRWIEASVPSIAYSRHLDNLNTAAVIFMVFYRTLLLHCNLL